MGIKHERVLRTIKRSVLWRSGQNLSALQAESKFWAPQEAAKPRMSGVRVSSLRPPKYLGNALIGAPTDVIEIDEYTEIT